MPHKKTLLLPLSSILPLSVLVVMPAEALTQPLEEGSQTESILYPQAGSSNRPPWETGRIPSFPSDSGNRPPWEVRSEDIPGIAADVLESQGGLPAEYGNILNSSIENPQSIPGSIFGVMQSEGAIPEEYTSIFQGGSSSPGSIPDNVWDVMQSQGDISGGYEGILDGVFGDLGSDGITPPFAGLSPDAVGFGGTSSQQIPVVGIPTEGANAEGWTGALTGSIPGAEQVGNIFSSIGNQVSKINLPSLSNPFGRIIDWTKNTPAAKAIGTLGRKVRGIMTNSSWGFFTRNKVVKQRDQANLFDQELARMMADPRLGENSEQLMLQEAQQTLSVMSGGIEGAQAAMQLGQQAQGLTSTQDVAKAVAAQGSQNAAISAALIQMQGQSIASLQELQQLTAASIQLGANNSEGIDEINRSKRIERTTALRNSASESIYVPYVYLSEEEIRNGGGD